MSRPENYLYMQADQAYPGGAQYDPLIEQNRLREEEALAAMREQNQGPTVMQGLAAGLISALPMLVARSVSKGPGLADAGAAGSKASMLYMNDLDKQQQTERGNLKEDLKGYRDKGDTYLQYKTKADQDRQKALYEATKDDEATGFRNQDLEIKQEGLGIRRKESAANDDYRKRMLELQEQKANSKDKKPQDLGATFSNNLTYGQSFYENLGSRYNVKETADFSKEGQKRALQAKFQRDHTNLIFDKLEDYIRTEGATGGGITDYFAGPKTLSRRREKLAVIQREITAAAADSPEARQGLRKDEAARLLAAAGLGIDVSQDVTADQLIKSLGQNKTEAFKRLDAARTRLRASLKPLEDAAGIEYVEPPFGVDVAEWEKARTAERKQQITRAVDSIKQRQLSNRYMDSPLSEDEEAEYQYYLKKQGL